MLDALRYRVTDKGLFVLITDAKELKKATWTNETRPWINLSRGEATQLQEFVTKLMRAQAKE
jgi:hypothetical protein